MKPRTLCAAGVAALAVVGFLTPHGVPAPPGLVAAPGPAPDNPCAEISPRSLDRLQRSIQRALRSAEADARAHGETGAYAVAATNSRDLLARSESRIADAIEFLRGSSPSVTTYAEGGKVKEYVRSTFEWVSQAGHWALISAAYHKSPDARDAFEGAVIALGEAQQAFGESGRCYMSGYL